MQVESAWIDSADIDAKLRASLLPLPPPDERSSRTSMNVKAFSTPIPREDPDDPPAKAESQTMRPKGKAAAAAKKKTKGKK